MILRIAQLLEQIIDKHGFRDKERLLQDLAQNDIIKTIDEPFIEQPLGMNQSNDIVLVSIIDRNPREALFENALDDFLGVILNIHHKGIRPRHHQFTRHQLIQRENPLQHLNFICIQGLLTIGQHIFNLIPSHLFVCIIKLHRGYPTQQISRR